MKTKIIASVIAAGIAVGAGIAKAQTVDLNTGVGVDTETALEIAPDNTQVSLTGVITSVGEDEFRLGYGTGEITVDLNEWTWDDAQMAMLEVGDRVTVSGQIDNGLFEGREIKADNVYVVSDNRLYYRESTDRYPMGAYGYGDADVLSDGSYVTMAGMVSNLNGDEFILTNENNMSVQVDLAGIDIEDRLKEGDMIQVYGEIDEGFFENKEIVASRVVTMLDR